MASILFKIRRICKLHLKFNCLKSEKLFFNFKFYLWKLHQILTRLKKETIVIANIFPKLKTVKVFLRPLSKTCRFRTCFDSQHVRASQILANFSWGQFFHAFSSFSVRLIWKLSPLVLGEMLGEFVNTLNADDKYPVEDSENLPLRIQMQVSKKQETFSECFVPFLEPTPNFKSFEKKGYCHS